MGDLEESISPAERGEVAGDAPREPAFLPPGEAKCVRGPSVQGARRSASGGVFLRVQRGPLVSSWRYRSRQRLPFSVRPGKYIEHGQQAQRSSGGTIAHFGRQVARNAG